jgi:hypothetical protein
VQQALLIDKDESTCRMPNALPASCRVKGEGLSDFQRPDDFQPSCQGLVEI